MPTVYRGVAFEHHFALIFRGLRDSLGPRFLQTLGCQIKLEIRHRKNAEHTEQGTTHWKVLCFIYKYICYLFPKCCLKPSSKSFIAHASRSRNRIRNVLWVLWCCHKVCVSSSHQCFDAKCSWRHSSVLGCAMSWHNRLRYPMDIHK